MRGHRGLPSFPTRRSSDLSATRNGRTPSAEIAVRFQPFCVYASRRNACSFSPVFTQRRALTGCVRRIPRPPAVWLTRSEEHTSELQSQFHLVCRLLLEKKK